MHLLKINGIYRLEPPFFRPADDYTPMVKHLLELARKKNIRYIFSCVDPRDLGLLRALGELGFCLIETRLYYHADLKSYSYPERFAVRVATNEDVDSLGKSAQRMVNLYDRFHSDPFIKPEDADRLMYKWVQASVGEGFADVAIVPNSSNPMAFCTVKYHKDKWDQWGLRLSQPVFSAVSSEYRGWYRKIISEINYHLKGIGAEHAYLATQTTNNPVIWVWENLGYHYGKAEHIFRCVL